MSVYENTANAQSASGSRDEEYLLTEGEAQLATVLALMTGFSQGCCAVHRAPMAQRVADQLMRMTEGLDGSERSDDMRHFLLRLGQRWATVARVLAQSESGTEGQSSALRSDDEFSNPQPHWHHSPETLQ
ncbi:MULTISPECIES: hypothetical protein [Comamonas]|jgi:hypothetical protein|uniref:hypothetical protein n=1 Tax=Comamonas TaxID=283 RepID=UPI0025F615D2|nr:MULTISPECIES: hypothetical protein [Comamonas]MDR3066471.1 hypothetical protein [Comamonas sp.]MEB5965369.1 hypothetical protein [Comamonas testosteroni]